ncbi:MAG: FUSC family protein [Shewanella sp.]
MQSKDSIKIEQSNWSWLNFSSWLWPFFLSEKFKFASRVALSLTLSYLIPMAMGWPQASTAATTVMLIASTGSRRESIAQGTYRVIGTLIGAVIGLLLVGLFAQDRILYMLAVSVVVSVIFYFRNAYKKDPSVFMLTGVMVLMMSNGGDANGAFIYGIDRAFMTAFGVVVFTLVSVSLFPVKTEQNLRALAHDLNHIQTQIFHFLTHTKINQVQAAESNSLDCAEESAEKIDVPSLLKQLFAAQEALDQRYASISAECSDVSAYKKEWDLALLYYKQITELLIFVAESGSHSVKEGTELRLVHFITDYDQTVQKLASLFVKSDQVWDDEKHSSEVIEHRVNLDETALKTCTHLVKGKVLTYAYVLNQLHEKLSKLTATINCIDSVTRKVDFSESFPKTLSQFIWWDAENAKTAIKVFVTYWIAGLIWIYFNPPGGYSFVIFSVIYMSLLSFLPVHPVMLLGLFTFGFLFSVPAYVFVLPGLTLGAELGIFIFIYTFIGFYLFKGPVTIFFLMGLFVLGIDNTMNYNFAVLLSIMMMFYLVVFMIILSYYFPFSSRPEHLFLVMRERFFRHAAGVILCHQILKPDGWQRLRADWHQMTMNMTVKKLTLWSEKINNKQFKQTTPQALEAFSVACELLNNHLNIFVSIQSKFATNELVLQGRHYFKDKVLLPMTTSLAGGNGKEVLDEKFRGYDLDYQVTELQLEDYLNDLDLSEFSATEISGFYIFLNLKKNVFDAISQCQRAHKDISWNNLRQKRF